MTDAEKLEVLKALHIIQRECKEHETCWHCMLNNEEGGGCSLEEAPNRWDLPLLPKGAAHAVDE